MANIKKEIFIDSIQAIRDQMKYDLNVSVKLGEVFPNAYTANLLPVNHFVTNALIRLLQEGMNDNEICKYGMSWIEWFCFETDFGSKSNSMKAYDKDNQPIKMDDAGDLWDFLNSL